MKIRLLALLAACLMALPLVAQSYNTYTAQAGVSFFTGANAAATAVSGPTRLPTFSGSGTLTIVETGITGSPSGCTVKLAYQANNAASAGGTVSTTSFTPSTGTQTFTITPGVLTGDQYVATYACSSIYPTAGIINATFSPSATGSLDPCSIGPKSSVAISITTATTTQLVALAAGKAIYVCGLTASPGLSDTLKLEQGTAANCSGGTNTALTGTFTSDAAVIGFWNLGGEGTKTSVAAGDALCAVSTGTGGIYGVLTYVQQ